MPAIYSAALVSPEEKKKKKDERKTDDDKFNARNRGGEKKLFFFPLTHALFLSLSFFLKIGYTKKKKKKKFEFCSSSVGNKTLLTIDHLKKKPASVGEVLRVFSAGAFACTRD